MLGLDAAGKTSILKSHVLLFSVLLLSNCIEIRRQFYHILLFLHPLSVRVVFTGGNINAFLLSLQRAFLPHLSIHVHGHVHTIYNTVCIHCTAFTECIEQLTSCDGCVMPCYNNLCKNKGVSKAKLDSKPTHCYLWLGYVWLLLTITSTVSSRIFDNVAT